jgi:hypothetical protein
MEKKMPFAPDLLWRSAALRPLAPVVLAAWESAVRSTLLQSSLTSLREHGKYDSYLAGLAPQHRERILGSLAPEWLPVEIAFAHYTACDALGLDQATVAKLGEEVGDRVQGTFIGTLLRSARMVGFTPWTALGQVPRLWERVFQGGAIALYKRGPKDAAIEVRGMTLAGLPYFRQALRGVFAVGIRLCGARSVAVRIADSKVPQERLLLWAEWV